MLFTVATYHGTLPLSFHTSTRPHALPTTGVAWLDLQYEGWAQRLQGRDYFWVHDLTFGMYNDPANLAWYGGNPHEQYTAWRWTSAGSELIAPFVPDEAIVFKGVLLPDAEWLEVTRAHPLVLA